MIKTSPTYPRRKAQQSGVALVVALIFLVILTLLGIAALSNNTLQTRMAYGASETSYAFESTETALSAGENWVGNQTVLPLQSCTANCAGLPYIWPRPDTNPPVSATVFFDDSWWMNNGRKYGYTSQDGASVTYDAAQAFTNDTDAPRYVVEYLGVDPSSSLKVGAPTYHVYDYQVTARGFGVQGQSGPTRTVTQSVYGKGF